MITLTHTGLRVPPTHVHVTATQRIGSGRDTIEIATVRQRRTLLGHTTNTHDGPTRFVAVDQRAAYVVWSFAMQTALFNPGLTEATVLDHLIAEHDWELAVRDAGRRWCYLLRVIDASGLPAHAELLDIAASYPDYPAAVRAARKRSFPTDAARAELWTGDVWTQIHPDQQHTAEETS
ncbi:hypothetical protein [Nocardiopsis dassonvillei]|uniref:hypothetical protein n=1 Tax=Nocardiopsis dassonvillei TaxID=2014 RepID=UPI0036431113